MAQIRNLERKSSDLIYDTRPFGARFAEWLLVPIAPVIVLSVLSLVLLLLPHFSEAIFVIGGLLFVSTIWMQDEAGLAMMMPKHSGLIDPKELVPAKKGKKRVPAKAEGIIYVGNCAVTKEEIWLTDAQARTHMVFLGTTGSGKTEFLLSVACANAIIQGSGLIYVDGKADNSLYGKIYSMARAFGREQDVLLINFQTGGRDIYGAQPVKMSNTMNMFSVGSSGMLIELVKALKESSDDDIWVKQADGFISALIAPLVYLRDVHKMQLDVNVIRNYFTLNKVEDLAWVYPSQYPGLEESGKLEGIRAYLMTKPGYAKDKIHQQSSTVNEQHGYIAMQLMETFGDLSDTYGYIMKTPLAEIDFVDVFLNRRILVAMLPALEKSTSALANLGRIIAASTKAVMAQGLGSRVEGEWSKIITSKPSSSPTPFPATFDEYGFYTVEGFSAVPAQARSLGFWTNFGGQDLPGFNRSSKEEAGQTLSNTNAKFFGKTTCLETYEYAAKMGGKGRYTMLQRYELDSGTMLGSGFNADKQVSVEQVDRITLEDLRAQMSGKWNMIYGNTIVTVDGFFANPKPVKNLRVNHFLRIGRPSQEEVSAFRDSAHIFERAILSDGGLKSYMDVPSAPADLKDIRDGFSKFGDESRVIAAGKVLAYCAKQEGVRADHFRRLSTFDAPAAEFDFAATMQTLGVAAPAPAPAPSPVAMDAMSATATPEQNLKDFFADVLEAEAAADAAEDGGAPTAWGSPSQVPIGSGADALATLDMGALEEDALFNLREAPSPVPGKVFNDSATPTADVFGSDTVAPPDLGGVDDLDLAEMGEAESADWGALTFEPPKAAEGLLSREATVSGLAAIEQALGSSKDEAAVTSAIVAEDLGNITTYPITPPKKAPNLDEFKDLATKVASLLEAPFDED